MFYGVRPVPLAIEKIVFQDVEDRLPRSVQVQPGEGPERHCARARESHQLGPAVSRAVAEEHPQKQHGSHGRGQQRRIGRGARQKTRHGGKHQPRAADCGHSAEEGAHDQEHTQPVGLPDGAEFENRDVQTHQADGAHSGRHPPARLREAAKQVARGQQHGQCGHRRRNRMGRVPRLAENSHPAGIPVSVEGRLRENKIEIGPLAASDQLRRQQVESLIPGKRARLRINSQRGGYQQ